MKIADVMPPSLASPAWDAVGDCLVRPLAKEDEGKTGALILDVVYLPHRKAPGTLAGARIIRADIGNVGDHYADIWTREIVLDPSGASTLRANPFRAASDKNRLFVLI